MSSNFDINQINESYVLKVSNDTYDFQVMIICKRFVKNIYVKFENMLCSNGYKYSSNWSSNLTFDQFEKLIRCDTISIECIDERICTLILPNICHVNFIIVIPDSFELYKMIIELQKQIKRLDKTSDKTSGTLRDLQSQITSVKYR